ncbi:MAG: hypothetical protein JWN75_273 [Candidatus Saccharibacteria bacterium]|nr:hypothetical protein [Candidatus Saccharibacteria bacterium]
MKKRNIVGIISAGLLLLGAVIATNNDQSNKVNTFRTSNVTSTAENVSKKVILTCDGKIVTTDCTLEGTSYKIYIYHPAIAEKSHIETVTSYKQVVTGYCTLCDDGTYSPSCATGRGACSHHGGVAQWNAPISSNVPVQSNKTIIDAAAQEAFYEKVLI